MPLLLWRTCSRVTNTPKKNYTADPNSGANFTHDAAWVHLSWWRSGGDHLGAPILVEIRQRYTTFVLLQKQVCKQMVYLWLSAVTGQTPASC
jgi:hypothetical protein